MKHKQLENFLKKSKAKFKVLSHKVVYTAYDAASTQKKKLSEIAKVVLVKADKGWALVIVPANKYLDLAAIKTALKAKKISIATEKDITKYLKAKIGLLHPFGNLYKIPTLLDKGIVRSKKLLSSAGSYVESLEMAVNQFEKLVQPLKGNFSKAKKQLKRS